MYKIQNISNLNLHKYQILKEKKEIQEFGNISNKLLVTVNENKEFHEEKIRIQ